MTPALVTRITKMSAAAAREAGGAKGGRAIEVAGDEAAARTIGGDAAALVKRRAARSHRPIDDPRARHVHHKDVALPLLVRLVAPKVAVPEKSPVTRLPPEPSEAMPRP